MEKVNFFKFISHFHSFLKINKLLTQLYDSNYLRLLTRRSNIRQNENFGNWKTKKKKMLVHVCSWQEQVHMFVVWLPLHLNIQFPLPILPSFFLCTDSDIIMSHYQILPNTYINLIELTYLKQWYKAVIRLDTKEQSI